MFLIDKYKPQNKNDVFFHKNIVDMLDVISKDDAIPHIIFYGPNGSGKKTLINIFLKMIYGENVNNTKNINYKIVSNSKTKIEKIKQSNYHIVINPKGTNYDRHLIYNIVKEYTTCKSLNAIFENNKQFKIVLINNLDNLSFCAQTALRRTMEKNNDKCRFLMWCSSLSKVIEPLQSRCICIRIPCPSDNELMQYIFKISIMENICHLTIAKYCEILKKANGNIKSALWELEFEKYNYVLNTDYHCAIDKIIGMLFKTDMNQIKDIRNILFNLMITNYNGITILKDLTNKLCEIKKINTDAKYKIIASAALVDYRLLKGRREIIHLDHFIISIMKIFYEQKLNIVK